LSFLAKSLQCVSVSSSVSSSGDDDDDDAPSALFGASASDASFSHRCVIGDGVRASSSALGATVGVVVSSSLRRGSGVRGVIVVVVVVAIVVVVGVTFRFVLVPLTSVLAKP